MDWFVASLPLAGSCQPPQEDEHRSSLLHPHALCPTNTAMDCEIPCQCLRCHDCYIFAVALAPSAPCCTAYPLHRNSSMLQNFAAKYFKEWPRGAPSKGSTSTVLRQDLACNPRVPRRKSFAYTCCKHQTSLFVQIHPRLFDCCVTCGARSHQTSSTTALPEQP